MSKTGIDWSSEFPRFVADVVGNGRADLIGCGKDGVWVSQNDGQGNFLPPELGLVNFGYGQDWRAERHVRAMGQFGGAHIDSVSSLHATSAFAVESRAPGRAVGRPIVASSNAGADMVGFGDDGVWIALSQEDGKFNSAGLVLQNLGFNQGWRVDRHPRMLADLNGDGLSDIVGFGDAGVWTALCKGQSTSRTALVDVAKFVLANFGYNQGWRVDQHPRLLANLTSSGHADIVGFGNDGMWVAVGRGDGSFADAKFAISDFGFNQGWRVNVHERSMGDLTGDGKADFVGFGDDGVWTSLGIGDGSFAPAKLVVGDLGSKQGWRTDKHPRMVADLTGNKHADLVGFGDAGVWTALGNGDGTFQAPRFVLANFGVNQGWTVVNHPRFLADINGDGLPDIVGFGDAGVWVALNKGDGTFAEPHFVLADFGFKSGQTGIKHVFVLMLENRSYDHFLGFTKITGTDTQTGQATQAEGLKENESNVYEGVTSTVSSDAPDTMGKDPPHQFKDVLIQLCGPEFDRDGAYDGGPYPAVNGGGYAAAFGIVTDKAKSGEVMRCFSKENLPVLTALASEFVVCDRWFSAMAGPTEPNRMFVHAATSGVWDDSPTGSQQFWDEMAGGGIKFDTGTIFDRLRQANVPFRIYAGDHFPNVALLHGISVYSDVDDFGDFASDVKDPNYGAAYTLIEPDYETLESALGLSTASATSQHPSNSVARGEGLIKQVYEAIRNSPHWSESMLIIAWDENGGFFDHVKPPRAVPTGSKGQAHGYIFDQYGPRVPAVVISPLCAQNMIEHRTLEHSVVPATVEQVFGLGPLTVRDSGIIGLQSLVTLQTPRTNTPTSLPVPVAAFKSPDNPVPTTTVDLSLPLGAFTDGLLTSTVGIALKAHVEAVPADSVGIKQRVVAMKTVGDLAQYYKDAIPIIRNKRIQARQQRVEARNRINRLRGRVE